MALGSEQQPEEVVAEKTRAKSKDEGKRLDLDRPLLPQVEDLTEETPEELEAIYRRSSTWASRTPMLFDPSRGIFRCALEVLTRTGPLQVAAVWIPVSVWAFLLCARGLEQEGGAGTGSARAKALGVACFGMFKWSLIEYVMHRFMFHAAPPSGGSGLAKFQRKLHFASHAVHHVVPSDPKRLNVPPVFCLFPILAWWAVAWMMYGVTLGNGVLSGALFGYVCYEQVHHAAHYRLETRPKTLGGRLLRLLGATPANRKRHIHHHNRDDTRGFGVTGPFWDGVFGTRSQVDSGGDGDGATPAPSVSPQTSS